MSEAKKKEPQSNWDDKIEPVEKFFNSIKSWPVEIELSCYEKITNVKLFVDSHMNVVKAQNGRSRFSPYLRRLMRLKEFMITNKIDITTPRPVVHVKEKPVEKTADKPVAKIPTKPVKKTIPKKVTKAVTKQPTKTNDKGGNAKLF